MANAPSPDSVLASDALHGTAPARDATRRDFLFLATGAFGVVGTVAAMVPLIAQMEPDASTIAAGGPVDVDLKSVAPGQMIIVRWRSRPIFIVNRPEKLLATLKTPQLVALLSDPNSQNLQQPSYADNWHRSIKPEFGVLVGICTHLGCIPEFFPNPSPTTPTAAWLGGYFCPCHGSKYDLAGRVFKGVPAPYNLPVPPYRFVNDTTLRIGENPPGSTFDFDSIIQL
ncbi:MAG TPA: ubiquinol-cytochrome c reductase iron-sulfur subunit [Methylovirgula sp.]|nr:ubiquinol-cytochrome c reductase iron-sulfur subunit [Methylovirgula sp.]